MSQSLGLGSLGPGSPQKRHVTRIPAATCGCWPRSLAGPVESKEAKPAHVTLTRSSEFACRSVAKCHQAAWAEWIAAVRIASNSAPGAQGAQNFSALWLSCCTVCEAHPALLTVEFDHGNLQARLRTWPVAVFRTDCFAALCSTPSANGAHHALQVGQRLNCMCHIMCQVLWQAPSSHKSDRQSKQLCSLVVAALAT